MMATMRTPHVLQRLRVWFLLVALAVVVCWLVPPFHIPGTPTHMYLLNSIRTAQPSVPAIVIPVSNFHTKTSAPVATLCSKGNGVSRLYSGKAAHQSSSPITTNPLPLLSIIGVTVFGSFLSLLRHRHKTPSPSLPPFLHQGTSRRQVLLTGVVAHGFLRSSASQATPLAPLGRVGSPVGGSKRMGISAQEVADVLLKDLTTNGGYFVNGQLTPEIFTDDCRFVDPTNDIRGLSRYLTALTLLFDPQYSSVEDVELIDVRDNSISIQWTLGGYLKFPWNPRVERFRGVTMYTLDPNTGLIVQQEQTWEKSATTALRESFTPTFTPPTRI